MEKAREEINEFNFKIEKCEGEIKELEKIVSEAEEENNIAKAVEYLEKANRKRKEVRKLVEKQQSKIKDCFEIVRPTVTEEEFEDVITGLEDAIGPTGLAGTEQ
jgi:chromosome segregation ATPase